MVNGGEKKTIYQAKRMSLAPRYMQWIYNAKRERERDREK